MKRLFIAFLLAFSASAEESHPLAFRLEGGDFRWIPFTVRQVPTEVDCRFEVLQGDATVHVELLPMSEFRLFNRGRKHETLAVSPDTKKASFRRIVDRPGQYAVVVKNAKDAPIATVSLEMSTDVNPNSRVVAKELPPRRRLVTILVSFLLFFAMVAFAGLKLLRGGLRPA